MERIYSKMDLDGTTTSKEEVTMAKTKRRDLRETLEYARERFRERQELLKQKENR